jgi:hypothetical protein
MSNGAVEAGGGAGNLGGQAGEPAFSVGTAPAEWADRVGQTLQFTSVSQPARFGLDHSSPDIELVLTYYRIPDEIALPLVREWCAFVPPGLAPA